MNTLGSDVFNFKTYADRNILNKTKGGILIVTMIHPILITAILLIRLCISISCLISSIQAIRRRGNCKLAQTTYNLAYRKKRIGTHKRWPLLPRVHINEEPWSTTCDHHLTTTHTKARESSSEKASRAFYMVFNFVHNRQKTALHRRLALCVWELRQLWYVFTSMPKGMQTCGFIVCSIPWKQ